jgi:O-antigen/teichoic acid export membrane protein
MAQLPAFMSRAVSAMPASVRNSSFLKAFAILSSGTVIQTVIVLAVSPILSRLFTPEEFGVVGLFLAVTGILTPLAGASYHGAILLPRRQTDALNIFMLALLLPIVIGPLSLLIGSFIPDRFQPVDLPKDQWLVYAPLIVFTVFIHQALTVYRNWEIRRTDYRNVFNSQIWMTVGMVITQLIAGVLSWGGMGLIIGHIMGYVCPVIYMQRLLWKSTRGRMFKVISLKHVWRLAKQHWQFPVYSTPSQVLFAASRNLPSFLLAAYFSTTEVGLYWFANRVLIKVEQSFGQHITRICFQRCAQRRNQNKPNLAIFLKSTGLLAAITVFPLAILIFFGPTIFSIVFGAEWERSGLYASWLCLFVVGIVITMPARSVLTVYEIQKLTVFLEVVRLPLLAGAFVVGCYLGDDVTAIAWLSIAQLLLGFGFVAVIAAVVVRCDRAWALQSRRSDPTAFESA